MQSPDIKFMNNEEVAQILYNISIMLEMQGVEFKPAAYSKAARVIGSMEEDINSVKDLDSIPGVGESIAKKIKELIDTGKLKYYEELKKKVPVDIEDLTSMSTGTFFFNSS